MNMQKKNVLKLCSFYVSEWHLITMLLPYINKKVNEETKIATILENDIKTIDIEKQIEKIYKKLSVQDRYFQEPKDYTTDIKTNFSTLCWLAI